MNYPNELEFLEFFECESEKDDDVEVYKYSDSSGISIVFSYNPFEDWAKTQLLFRDRVVSAVLVEGLKEMKVRDGSLSARFEVPDLDTTLTIKTKPFIEVEWNGLINYR